MYNPFNTPTNLRVTNLVLRETGQYHQQYRRPYITQITPHALNAIVQECSNKSGQKLTDNFTSKFTSDILTPSATPEGEASIVNGWAVNRLRFSLSLECTYTVGGKVNIHIQGYTEYSDLSYNTRFDPRMRFFINSIFTTSFVNTVTAYGVMQTEHVRDCSHLLVNTQVSQNIQPNMFSMRPQDVFATMQHTHINDSSYFGSDTLLDTRSMVRATPSKSKRVNGVTSQYLTNLVNGYTTTVLSSSFEDDEATILNKARSTVSEEEVCTDPFLNAMMGIMGNNQISNTFTYNDLMRLDPNVDNIATVTMDGISEISMSKMNQSSQWHGTDRYTHAATIIAHSFPSIMVACGFTYLSCISSNDNTSFLPFTQCVAGKAIGVVDMERSYAAVQTRINNEIMNVISFNNQSQVTLSVTSDNFGDTVIDLNIDNQGVVRYITPTFCDSIYNPVVTANNQTAVDVASDLGCLMTNLRDALTATPSYGSLNLY